jgi:hypothetical protein
MTIAIVQVNITGGGKAIVHRHASATNKEIEVAIAIKVVSDGHADIYAVIIVEGAGIETEIAFAIIFTKGGALAEMRFQKHDFLPPR